MTTHIDATAEVLYTADPFTTGSAATARKFNTREWQAAITQAQALATASLIATETETRLHYTCSPNGLDGYCDEAFLTGHCEHQTTQTRNVTPWKDV